MNGKSKADPSALAASTGHTAKIEYDERDDQGGG
jgi:hypothetical protein